MIIAIEGIDAAGKATQAKLLAERLGNSVVISFPDYSTKSGEMILSHLKGGWDCRDGSCGDGSCATSPVDPWVFQALMTINRLEVLNKINMYVRKYDNIIFDRYITSGLCYGSIDGVDPYWIMAINSVMPITNLNILIDIDAKLSVKRRPERRDRYEANINYMIGARDLYLQLFTGQIKFCNGGNLNGMHFDGREGRSSCVVNGDESIENVNIKIMLAVYMFDKYGTTIRDVIEP